MRNRKYADIAQSVERILGKDEVTSSNLVISSNSKHFRACFFIAIFMAIKKPSARWDVFYLNHDSDYNLFLQHNIQFSHLILYCYIGNVWRGYV